MMCQLRLPVSLLISLMLLRCFNASPSYRYFNPYSSSEQESTLSDGEAWLTPELLSKPFIGFMGSRPQRGLPAINSHHVEKRKCNTATCVTQRLADFLARSSKTIGTVNEPTNVGSGTYGKRDLQPRTLPPLVLH